MPETQYASSGELSIAYQCVGDGPVDVLFIPGFVSNVELMWDIPKWADLFTRLSELGRFVFFDKRGTGCSDRTLGTGSAEDRMDDARAVADAAGIEQAVVIGLSEGGPLAVLFAAAFPERVRSLVLWGTFARIMHAPDYEDGAPPKLVAAAEILHHNVNMDVRYALGALRVPTLVVHRTGDPIVPVVHARYLAEHIADARLIEIPGDFHVGGVPGEDDPVVDAIAEFVTGAPAHREVEVDRVLTTVLFTDIVDSTARAASIGDRAWRTLLEQHDAAAGEAVEHHRGVVVKRTGDGLLATFDGPGRGIRAACALQTAVRPLGIEVRAGLRTGEVERRADDVAGIGVHIGARVSALAGPGEVLVTSTVKDLVIGSELQFDDRGAQTLKGVPGDWHLWAAN